MSFRVSVPAIFCVVSLLGASGPLLAQQPTGADRIYAAEAKAAALKAQNEQLRQSIATQSAALKRLDDQINLMRQDHELQYKTLVEQRDAEIQALRSSNAAQMAALREANAALSEQVQSLRQQSNEQAKNEAMLDDKARTAQVEAARLEALVEAQAQELQSLQQDFAQLQQSHATAQSQAQEAPQLRADYAKAVDEVKSLRQQLDQSEAQRVALMEAQAGHDAVQADNERLRAQLDFMQERNSKLQEALSVAPAQDQLSDLQTALDQSRAQVSTLQSALKQAQEQQAQQEKAQQMLQLELAQEQALASSAPELEAQLSTLRTQLNQAQTALAQSEQTRQALQLELAQAQAQATPGLQQEHQALQTEYNQLVDGIRSCEARLQTASQAPAAPSSHPEDIRRISELEAALDRANAEIRNTNRAFEEELKVERAMAAGSEAELEQQYQKRIQAMQEALQSCRGV